MWKTIFPRLFTCFIPLFAAGSVFSQESGRAGITEHELREHLTYLASDGMQGRATGEPGLDLAAEYLAGQAAEMGLKPIDDSRDYFQEYTLVRRSQDFSHSSIKIKEKKGAGFVSYKPFYFLLSEKDRIDISGEPVFAGYGIHSPDDGYDDLEKIKVKNKLLVILSGGPEDEWGNPLLKHWNGYHRNSFIYKLPPLANRKPLAILVVPDPRSGCSSWEEISWRMTRTLSRSRFVKELGDEHLEMYAGISPPVIFIHREIADRLLKDSEKTLSELQHKIDAGPGPYSFDIKGKMLNIHAEFQSIFKTVPNVAGLIKGSDPELSKELIVYTAHYDHLGVNPRGLIFHGADDNASGTAALLEIAEAFKAEQKNLKRSVLILWTSGEEIGLLGSEYYSEFPLLPLENTLANINLDMVGAIRTERDTGSIYNEEMGIMGMDSILLIGGHQSSQLLGIHNRLSAELGIYTDFSRSSPNHPYGYYFRSDHFNFARNDIPVLFYTTGTHADYHKTTDDISRIHFTKLKRVTELSFLLGYELVTMPGRINVDNPFSTWGSYYLR